MDIQHDKANNKIWLERNGNIATVEYKIHDGTLDILHTYVPPALEGQGIASLLVKSAYDFAIQNEFTPKATCSYAKVWLKRHPEYIK